jgi:hypothetical protein
MNKMDTIWEYVITVIGETVLVRKIIIEKINDRKSLNDIYNKLKNGLPEEEFEKLMDWTHDLKVMIKSRFGRHIAMNRDICLLISLVGLSIERNISFDEAIDVLIEEKSATSVVKNKELKPSTEEIKAHYKKSSE